MYVLIVAIMATSGIALSACGQTPPPEDPQVLTLSVNPGVEFIVDKDDKVISVSASNEDGAYILEKFETFTGMTAQDAAFKFLELSEEYGFVVEGTMDEEKFTISVSGAGAETLYNNVKNKINAKVTELGLTIDTMVTMAKTDLEEMVANCYQEYSSSEIAAKTEKELVDMLKQSRDETKDLFTNEERQQYYYDRAQEVIDAKITAIKDYLSTHPSPGNAALTMATIAMDGAKSALDAAYTTINSTLDSLYNIIDTKRDEYVTKKQAYLDAVEEYKTALENNQDVTALKATLKNLRDEANTLADTLATKRDEAIDALRGYVDNTLGTLMDSINTKIDEVLTHISEASATIDAEVQAAINTLKTKYTNATSNPWEE